MKKIIYFLFFTLSSGLVFADGVCNKLQLDLDSASTSSGDWKEVKGSDGTPIKPSSFLHRKLFYYFMLGCNGEKDFSTARKVLFDISDLEPKSSSKIYSQLRSDLRHCRAEVWARYGIGGAKNEAQAQEFSRRFTMSAWFPNGEDTLEEREKIAKQYPNAVKDNFKCPNGNNAYRKDPRNPSLNLW